MTQGRIIAAVLPEKSEIGLGWQQGSSYDAPPSHERILPPAQWRAQYQTVLTLILCISTPAPPSALPELYTGTPRLKRTGACSASRYQPVHLHPSPTLPLAPAANPAGTYQVVGIQPFPSFRCSH